jgi:two-component system sensor histidine kinase UhpB
MHGIIPAPDAAAARQLRLGEALDDLVERTRRSQPGVQIELSVEPAGRHCPATPRWRSTRVAQEGISNACATAMRAGMQLEVAAADGSLTLTVRDDGHGLA